MIQQQQQLNGFWPLCNSILFAFWVRQDLGKSLCAWLYPRARSVRVAIATRTTHWFWFIFLCAWLSHAHVRVAKSRARILYTKTPSGHLEYPGKRNNDLEQYMIHVTHLPPFQSISSMLLHHPIPNRQHTNKCPWYFRICMYLSLLDNTTVWRITYFDKWLLLGSVQVLRQHVFLGRGASEPKFGC